MPIFEIKTYTDSDGNEDPRFLEVHSKGIISGEPWLTIVYTDTFYQWMSGQPTDKVLWYLSSEDKLFLDRGYSPMCLRILEGSDVPSGKPVHSNDQEMPEFQ